MIKSYVYVHECDAEGQNLKHTIIYGITNDDAEALLSQEEFKLKQGDRVYFMPGCNVPRFKIRDILKQYGASICKLIKDATVIVGGPHTIHSYSKSAHYYGIDSGMFTQWASNALPPIKANKLLADVKSCKLSRVLLSSNVLMSIKRNPVLQFEHEPDWWLEKAEQRGEEEGYHSDRDPENPCLNMWILSAIEGNETAKRFLNGDLKVTDQEPFLKIININSVTMDKQMFEEVRSMLKTSDNSNTVLAMEVMANCDYQKSFLYLCLLLREFGTKISEQREKNHINFKALLNFIGLQGWDRKDGVTIDHIIAVMTRKKLLTKSTLDQLMPIVSAEMTAETKSKNFQYKLEPSDQLKDQLVEETPEVEIVEEPKEPLDLTNSEISPNFDL